MKKTKQTYSTPEVETLVIRFEGNLLTGSDPKASVSSSMSRGGGYGATDEDYYNLD